MSETPEQSDQLPEEGPAEQVHDDSGAVTRRGNDSPACRARRRRPPATRTPPEPTKAREDQAGA